MAKIKVLPAWEAQKIAAGEVVERPASVIKELIENAIDAGADTIDLEVTQGGKTKIAVHDNGYGMSEEDALLCVHNHATSKITSVAELQTVGTFGFRGEALASIAAASKLTIATKEEQAQHGIRLVFEAGTCLEQEAIARQTGTSIIVENIFFNIPARRKFLKKDETEWRAIHQLVSALALAHQNITFSLTHNGRLALKAEKTTQTEQRFCQVLGMDLSEHLVAFDHESKYAKIRGITTRSPKTRYDKNQIFTFTNQRWVKNYKLAQALIKGYDNILLPQHFPLAALFIEVPHEEVDINVHPRKEEVQFFQPLGVERSIEEAVRSALEREIKTTLQTTAYFDQATADYPQAYSSTVKSQNSPFSGMQTTSFSKEQLPSYPTTSIKPAKEIAHATPQLSEFRPAETAPTIRQETYQAKPAYTILGQLHLTYIMLQTNEGLLMIDQHAAHERILFEKFRDRMNRAESTTLLFPQLVRLTPSEMMTILPHLELFEEQGIVTEPFGEETLRVQALPNTMKQANMEEFFKEISQKIEGGNLENPEHAAEKIYEHLHATMACKAAIKAGDRLSINEMDHLIEQILTTEHSTTCPHGRPTTWRIPLQEIERKFQRHL